MSPSEQKDYFSTQAREYKKFRPDYPATLYDFLQADLAENPIILDCATGNGQAAMGFAHENSRVLGIDLSFEQLSNASRKSNCLWLQSTVEALPIATAAIDLVCVAQALHWFNFEKFYPEVKRVLKPEGRIAVWTYSLLAACVQFEAPIENVVRWFYHDVVGDYWPPERRWVDDEYRSIPFPFEEIRTPSFAIEMSWDKSDLLGYISSWSAVQLYANQMGDNPMPLLEERLNSVWPEENYQIRFSWPLSVRVGR